MEDHDIKFIHDRVLLGSLIKRVEVWNKEKKSLEEMQVRYTSRPMKYYEKHIEIIDRLCKINNYMADAFIRIGEIFKRYQGHPLQSELLKEREYAQN